MPALFQIRSKLKLATFEYYRSLTMLKAYKVLNRTGFAKVSDFNRLWTFILLTVLSSVFRP